MQEKVWIYPSIDEEAKSLSGELDIPVEIARVLINRKITNHKDLQDFLYGTLDNLQDPFLFNSMEQAVKRIRKACVSGEKILIFGDYDVDGILSVVILTKALRTLGGNVDYFIPDRLSQGYGLKERYIDIVLERHAKLVISVDCGIKATGFVSQASTQGVDVIITDHHLPDAILPQALAVLNPKIKGSNYPDKHLAGIGVVFKLIQALFEVEGRTDTLPHYLKLVAIGTIADVVALRGENRLIVKFGLKSLEDVSNPGLKQLMEICRLTQKRVSVGDVGFRIGPRINAAGRLSQADLA
ncbi:MAG: DHH family phosphoesterase, partial [Candidatus Aminicenantes bacterium]